MYDIITQLVGVVGAAIFVLSYQIKSNRKLLFTQCLGAFIFSFQFILLGGYSGCVALLILVTKNIIISQRGKWRISDSKWTLVALILASAVNAVYNWTAWYDLLSFAAVLCGVIGYWGNNARMIRAINLFAACPAWIVYDFCVGSYAGIVSESITIISILVSIHRFGWKALGENSGEFTGESGNVRNPDAKV